MGGSATPRERHTVGEVVPGYIADGASRLSPGTIDFYRKGLAALPDAFRDRSVAEVTPLVLDGVHGELRDEGASEHKIQKVHRLLSAAFNRAVRYGWMVANPCLQATKPKVDTEEIEPPPPEWVRSLIADAEAVNEDLGVCVRLAAATGARRRTGGDSVGRLELHDLRHYHATQLQFRRPCSRDDREQAPRPCGHRRHAQHLRSLAFPSRTATPLTSSVSCSPELNVSPPASRPRRVRLRQARTPSGRRPG